MTGQSIQKSAIARHKALRTREKALTSQERVFAKEMVLHDDKMRALTVAFPDWDDRPEVHRKGYATRLMERHTVRREMDRLRSIAQQDAGFEVGDALAELLAIYRADPNELVSVRVGCCRYCHGEGHEYQWREREYLAKLADAEKRALKDPAVELPDCGGGFGFDHTRRPHEDCPECGGEGEPRVVANDTTVLSEDGARLYGGVKLTKYGPEIIIHDRMAAFDKICRIIGAYEDRVRVRAEVAVLTANIPAIETTDPNEAAVAYGLLMGAIDGGGATR